METLSMIDLKITSYSGPIEKVNNAQTHWSDRFGVGVTLFAKNGLFGQGEATPLPGYIQGSSDKAQEELNLCVKQLEKVPIKRLIPLKAQQGTWIESLEQLKEWVSSPLASFAIETALFDLLGKWLRCPLSSLLAEGKILPVPLSAWLYGQSENEILNQLESAIQRGIPVVKLKIGKKGKWLFEKNLMQTLVTRSQEAVLLRLDANQAWKAEEANRFLQELAEEIKPEFIEEPCKKDWPLQSPCALAMDESLQVTSQEEVALLLEQKRVQVLVLKPMALGGILSCLSWAQLAKNKGAEVVLTHCLDGPIALATTAELAMALKARGIKIRACGLDAHPGLGIWPRVSIPQLQNNQIALGHYFGHGVCLPQ